MYAIHSYFLHTNKYTNTNKSGFSYSPNAKWTNQIISRMLSVVIPRHSQTDFKCHFLYVELSAIRAQKIYRRWKNSHRFNRNLKKSNLFPFFISRPFFLHLFIVPFHFPPSVLSKQADCEEEITMDRLILFFYGRSDKLTFEGRVSPISFIITSIRIYGKMGPFKISLSFP